MRIYYNNEPLDLKEGAMVLDAIESQEVIEHKALWLNGEYVPFDEFGKIQLKENDRIKVVRIRGGG